MKKTGILLIAFVVMMVSCEGPGKRNQIKVLNDSIAALESEIFDPEKDRLERAKAIELIKLYQKVAYADPKSEDAPEFLFKAADLSINVQNPNQTIMIFDEILVDYPDYKKAPAVLFLKAFVYDDQLHDFVNAKKYYELFLEKYPNNEFTDDAEISLKNLGKTPEELIEEFQKNNP
ncbi:MAG TPA: tetratricopeptide repeat protein [Bacteroidales bacterium]